MSERVLLNDIDEGYIIQTNFQNSGKGQGKNTWESERGKNLLFSLLLKPYFLPASDQFVLTQIISLSVVDILKKLFENDNKPVIKVKWPNDIYIDNRKVAGILIQNTISGNNIENSIVGIGLNVNQKKFVTDAKNPVSLIHHLGTELSINDLLNQLLYAIAIRYNEVKELQVPDSAIEEVKTDYISYLAWS